GPHRPDRLSRYLSEHPDMNTDRRWAHYRPDPPHQPNERATMTATQDEIDRLVAYCGANLGDQELWITPRGYPGSLALCIIDSIYSTGSHYMSVVNVVNRYRAANGRNDGAQALLGSIAAAGGPRAWAESVVDNRKPANT